MPFDLLKKKKPSDDKGPDKADPKGKTIKKAAAQAGFDDAEESLKPDKEPKAKSGGMPSLRHALGVGKKEVSAADKRHVTSAIAGIDQMGSYALNMARRSGDFLSAYKNEGGTDAKLVSNVKKLASACTKLQPAMDRVTAAHTDYMKRGFMTPLRSAVQDFMKVATEIKLLLTGIAGPGDSCAEGSLMFNILGDDPVGGVQLGPKDKEAGKQLAGEKAAMSSDQAALPRGGGAGSGLWGRAIRGYADDYILYFGQVFASTRGL